MRFPVGNVEFWIVTAAFVAALAWLLRGPIRGVVRRLRGKGKPVRSQRASLTVGGRPPEKR